MKIPKILHKLSDAAQRDNVKANLLKEDAAFYAMVAETIVALAHRVEALESGEAVKSLLSAMPTIPHPGGKLVKVVAHYETGSTQTIDGDVIEQAIRIAKGEQHGDQAISG